MAPYKKLGSTSIWILTCDYAPAAWLEAYPRLFRSINTKNLLVKNAVISKLYCYIVNAYNSFIATLYCLADCLEPNSYYA